MKIRHIASLAWAVFFSLPGNALQGGRLENGYAAVVAFEGRGPWCGGTWLRSSPGEDDVMATAAHCLSDFTTGGVHILAGVGAGARSTGVSVQRAALSPYSVSHADDFALVYFPSGTGTGGVAIAQTLTPKDRLKVVAWEPSTKQKKSADNEVAAYNYETNLRDRMGYVLHEAFGGLPNQKGESGSPIFNSRGELVGVLRGCDPDKLINFPGVMRAGWSCFYTGATSRASLETLADANSSRPRALSAIDVSALVSMGQVGTLPGGAPLIAATHPLSPAPGVAAPSRATTAQPQARYQPPLQPQRAASLVQGPALAAVNPLLTLTQSPRGNAVTDLEGGSTSVRKRKLPELEEPSVPEWLQELVLEEREAKPERRAVLKPGEFNEDLDDGAMSEENVPVRKMGKEAADDLSEDLE